MQHLQREFPYFHITNALYKFVLCEVIANRYTPTNDSSNVVVQIERTDLHRFLHACISNAAKEFENNVDLLLPLNKEMSHQDKRARLDLCREAVKGAIIDFAARHGTRTKLEPPPVQSQISQTQPHPPAHPTTAVVMSAGEAVNAAPPPVAGTGSVASSTGLPNLADDPECRKKETGTASARQESFKNLLTTPGPAIGGPIQQPVPSATTTGFDQSSCGTKPHSLEETLLQNPSTPLASIDNQSGGQQQQQQEPPYHHHNQQHQSQRQQQEQQTSDTNTHHQYSQERIDNSTVNTTQPASSSNEDEEEVDQTLRMLENFMQRPSNRGDEGNVSKDPAASAFDSQSHASSVFGEQRAQPQAVSQNPQTALSNNKDSYDFFK